jgi:pentatricopeptide repeat protein
MAFMQQQDASGAFAFLEQTWDVVNKVVALGKFEIFVFVLTVIIALVMRSQQKSANGKKKAQKSTVSSRNGLRATPKAAAASSAPATATASAANAVALLADDAISMRSSTSNVLSRYAEIKASKKLLGIQQELTSAASPHTVSAFYQALVQCACRGSQPHLVESLLDDMEAIDCERSLIFYESAMRLLAAKKCFKEALAVHDRLERDGFTASAVTQSCLVNFSAELGLDDKTIEYFDKLCKSGPPSVRACMVVLRMYAKKQDWLSSVACLRSMMDLGVVDGLCLNIVLATGVSAGNVIEAEAFLLDSQAGSVADAISYNTVLKGLAQQGSIDQALQLFEKMKKQSVNGNLITYNTLIDAAVRARRTDTAWHLYDSMLQENGSGTTLKPDKCTCSTLVKALQHRPTSEQVGRVLTLVSNVAPGCQRDLACRLLSGVLYAALRMADLQLTLRTKSMMVEQGFVLSDADVRSIDQLRARKQ